MGLDGVHHVTTITADAPGTVDFWVRVMGLRLVKKTVNFDAPDMYHLYFGDETGSPGSLLTFFEIPGSPRGRAGAGMVHRIVWRVPSAASLDVWAARLGDAGTAGASARTGRWCRPTRRGSGIELVVAEQADGAPRAAWAPGIPAEHAWPGSPACASTARRPRPPSELLGTAAASPPRAPGRFVTRGAERRGTLWLDRRPRRARRARRGDRAPRGVDVARRGPRRLGAPRARSRAATRRG